MLKSTFIPLDTWRAHYHRIRLPRQMGLQRYINNVETKRARKQRAAASSAGTPTTATAQTQKHFQRYSSHITASSGSPRPENAAVERNEKGQQLHNHKYNRFFVNESWDFVASHHFVEDADITEQRRHTLPSTEPTKENLWKHPRTPYFEPFAPFLRIVDYSKDPDFKYMKPTNVPRWKDFMLRKKPVVPRTWY